MQLIKNIQDMSDVSPKKIKLIKDYQKIAAGEVVERPASVVKELVENSIDAGATQITIIIKNFGKELIQVIDNGCGIPSGEIETAFQAHTSSKIESAEELNSLSTLGFRGEALYSISAISKVEIISKTENSEYGIKLELEAGEKISTEKVGTTKGTNIKVKDIFYNTPVRYKFLKSDRVEMGHITDIITRLILIHPEIHFKLIHDEIPILTSPASNQRINAIYDIYGRTITREVKEFRYNESLLEIEGFLGAPSLARSSSLTPSIFVNKRYVKSPLIEDAVKEGYKDYIMTKTRPFYIINITLDSASVDFNIHPTKKIIRFENEVSLLNKLTRIFKEEVEKHFGSKKLQSTDKKENKLIVKKIEEVIDINKEEDVELKVETSKGINKKMESIDFEKHIQNSKDRVKSKKESRLEVKIDEFYPQNKDKVKKNSKRKTETIKFFDKKRWIDTNGVFPTVRIINNAGQLNNLYIILEGKEGFYILDMHAASERINYEKQQEKFLKGSISRQNLILPIKFDCPVNEKDFILENLENLKKFGFDIDSLGGSTFAIRSVPALFDKIDNEELIREICMDIITMGKERSLVNEYDRIIKYISCHMSYRGGDYIDDPKKIKELLLELSKCKNPHHCAHGRPTMLYFSWDQIDKEFHRK